MIGCSHLRGLTMQLKATKISVQDFGEMMEEKNEVEHKIAKQSHICENKAV